MAKAEVKYCTSCAVSLADRGFVRFPCPSCGKELGRCVDCRQQSNEYYCPSCDFRGP